MCANLAAKASLLRFSSSSLAFFLASSGFQSTSSRCFGPFGTGQRGNVFGGGGQGVTGIGTRINQIKNLLVGQADARNRALLT